MFWSRKLYVPCYKILHVLIQNNAFSGAKCCLCCLKYCTVQYDLAWNTVLYSTFVQPVLVLIVLVPKNGQLLWAEWTEPPSELHRRGLKYSVLSILIWMVQWLSIRKLGATPPPLPCVRGVRNKKIRRYPSPQPSPLGQGSQKQEKKVLPTPLSSPFESGEEEPTFSGRNKLKLII